MCDNDHRIVCLRVKVVECRANKLDIWKLSKTRGEEALNKLEPCAPADNLKMLKYL